MNAQYGSVDDHSDYVVDVGVSQMMEEEEEQQLEDHHHHHHLSLQNNRPVSTNNDAVGKFVVVRVLLPLLALAAFGVFSLLASPSSSLSPASVATTIAIADDGSEHDLSIIPSTTKVSAVSRSPFFEHNLEWIEIPLADTPSDYDHNNNNNNNGTTTNNKGNISNHFRASIEFCADVTNGLYGYGPVGKCIPGGHTSPLIRMKPKVFYHLTLYNNIDSGVDTNLHTHGLHVSGVGTVDDVTRVAKPGECLTYDYYILDDADVGTFWYHPHRHPLVTRSAYGGAYGMLIVDETVTMVEQQEHEQKQEHDQHHRSFYPDHLVNFLTKNEILLQFSSMYNKKLKNAYRSNKVNGKDILDLHLTIDTDYYVRVSSVVYAESVNYVEFDPPDACDVRVVAYDGVYRSEIPGPSLSDSKHMMTVSSRADFAVRCSKHADIHFHQGKKIKNLSKMVTIVVVDDYSSNENHESSLLSSVVVVSVPATLPSSPYWDPNAKTTWKPRRPYYMPDLSAPSNLVDEYWSVSMDDYFVNGTKGVSINQHWWDLNQSIRTFNLGQLIEIPIYLSQSHPYHSHINRMQIVEPGGCGGRFEEGEYFDTIVQSELKSEATPSGGCTIRTKFFDFAGRVVIHCHRWGHEDQGMMTWIDVLGGHGHGMKAGPTTSCAAVL